MTDTGIERPPGLYTVSIDTTPQLTAEAVEIKSGKAVVVSVLKFKK
jgi:hypothetical protein